MKTTLLKSLEACAWVLGAAAVIHCGNGAIQDIGYLFGWMIGASKSQISAAAAPLVFGLMIGVVYATLNRLFTAVNPVVVAKELKAVAGLPEHTIKRAVSESKRALAAQLVFAILTFYFTSWFIYHTRVGIHDGCEVREWAKTQE